MTWKVWMFTIRSVTHDNHNHPLKWYVCKGSLNCDSKCIQHSSIFFFFRVYDMKFYYAYFFCTHSLACFLLAFIIHVPFVCLFVHISFINNMFYALLSCSSLLFRRWYWLELSLFIYLSVCCECVSSFSWNDEMKLHLKCVCHSPPFSLLFCFIRLQGESMDASFTADLEGIFFYFFFWGYLKSFRSR